MTNRFWLLPLLCLGCLAPASGAGERVHAIRNARIVPVSGPEIAKGVIVLKGGRIAAMGAAAAIPRGAAVVDARGLTAYPGMIEGSTRLGLSEIASVRATLDAFELGEMNPHLLAAQAFNPHSELIPVTRVNGVTTVLASPGGGTISGQGVLVDLAGWTTEQMAIRRSAALHVQYPSPLAGAEAQRQRLERLRKLLKEAADYRPPASGAEDTADLRLEALQPYVRGELPVMLSASREAEIRGAIALAEEFRLKYVLVGLQEAYRVAPLLKEKNARCMVGPILASPARPEDPYDLPYTNPAALHRAGVRAAIISGETANARNLPYHAAMAMAHGLPPAEALRAVTLTPAEILGIDRDYGSLAPGKVGNLFLADGDPLDARTRVTAVYIRGEPVDMDNRHDALYRKFLRRLPP